MKDRNNQKEKKLFTVDQEGRVIETKMIMMEESKNVKQEEKQNSSLLIDCGCREIFSLIRWFYVFSFFFLFRFCILIANECDRDRDFDIILILSGMCYPRTGSSSFGNSSTFFI